jgi:hypothetical protein
MDGTIPKIDVRPVADGFERVVDYVFKTIKRGRVSYDEGVLMCQGHAMSSHRVNLNH